MTSDNNGGVRLQSVLDMPKVVRDLLWTVTSPHILSDAHYPVLPPEFGVDALEFVVVVEWFNGLAADPSPLVTFLQDMTKANGRSLALGVYFSALLEFWLRFCPHFNVERMDLGKQIVSSANRTMGQLKFLFRCNFPLRSESEEIRRQQRDFHVESSIKFFLLNPVDSKSTNGSLTANGSRQGAGDVENYDCIPLEQFVGPHLGENLAWRVQEVNRKLAASRGESSTSPIHGNITGNNGSWLALSPKPLHVRS
ncbi:hypothetical protein PHYBOEH_004912 [Phytophthora boehmeriae]|uniref:Uncharacterized protein n=1 Tax=Phytophthora boehmeriae TaxID=109152 RepID=A0A8T1X3X1_9STRA|nr:hypothetical protein PHYBOEH_004912 [Phytophthora boehmeriae]